LVLLTPVLGYAQGQQGSGSPYSAHGLGDLLVNTRVSQMLMGGLGTGIAEPFSLSDQNPATYSLLQRPVFEAGGVGRSIQQRTTTLTSRGSRMELLGLSLGIPFRQGRWGIALGAQPVSRVEYDMRVPHTNVDGQAMEFRYDGSGGLTRAFAGVSLALLTHRDSLDNGGRLSIGGNLNYLFGHVEESRRAYYPSGQGYYNGSVVGSLSLRAPSATAGIVYRGDLVKRQKREDDGLRYIVGVSAELPAQLTARSTEVVSTFLTGNSGVEFPVDTARFVDGAKGHLTLPMQLSVGFTVYDPRWTVGVEYRRRDWDRLDMDVEGYSLRSTLGTQAMYIAGASFRPAGDDRGTFWTRTIYRAGLRYTDQYLVLNGTQLNEVAASLGASFPLMFSTTRSRFHLGAEWSRRGSTSDGLMDERWMSLYLGVSITPDLREQWFRKRRFE
jgi:hypothetical protein